MKRVIPAEIEKMYAYCLKSGLFNDAQTILEIKTAMENGQKIDPRLKSRFQEVIVLYKTAKLLGRV